MPELVSDGEGCAEAVVLDDGAAVAVTHRPQFGQAEGVAVLAGGVGVAADVFPVEKRNSDFHETGERKKARPGQEQSSVVLRRVRVRVLVDVALPFAEGLQHVRGGDASVLNLERLKELLCGTFKG